MGFLFRLRFGSALLLGLVVGGLRQRLPIKRGGRSPLENIIPLALDDPDITPVAIKSVHHHITEQRGNMRWTSISPKAVGMDGGDYKWASRAGNLFASATQRAKISAIFFNEFGYAISRVETFINGLLELLKSCAEFQLAFDVICFGVPHFESLAASSQNRNGRMVPVLTPEANV